jgi:flagellar basal-body rod modification protein FlgD
MTIDAIINNSGASPIADAVSQAGNGALGRDEFLTLLVAQLKHQDPLNPLESHDFTAQMAQFSSLEQLFDVNASLAGIQEAIAGNEKDGNLDYIGKQVKAAGNTLYKSGESMDQGSYYIEDGAEVTISIFDGEGQEIRRIEAGYQVGGSEYELDWDGKNAAGVKVGDGIYTFDIAARDINGLDVYTETYSKGMVTGVSNQYAVPYLVIGERLLEPENVLETSIITE